MRPPRLLLALPLIFGLCPTPTEPPLERFVLETRFGALDVTARVRDIPALQEGAELAWARSSRELPGRVHEFPDILAGWEVVVHGNSSSISFAGRKMTICGKGAGCATHGFFHELGSALAFELRSCPHLASIWECAPFPGGRTLACEPC